jgi:hypothetical protein
VPRYVEKVPAVEIPRRAHAAVPDADVVLPDLDSAQDWCVGADCSTWKLDPTAGRLSVNCVHADSRGDVWSQH